MSSLLEQAIIDATDLKEVALKTAETQILEKYSREVKKTLSTLLEQEEDDLDLGGDQGGEELGGDLGGLDDEMGLGGEAEEGEPEPEAAKQVPDGFADGEKLCPCPEEDEEIEIDFNDLAKQLQDPEESDDEDAIDREEEFGLDDMGGEEEAPEEEDLGGLMEVFEDALLNLVSEEITFDGEPESSGWAGTPADEETEAIMLSLGKSLALADEKDTKDIDKDETLGDLVADKEKLEKDNLALNKDKQHLAESLKNIKAQSKKHVSSLQEQNKDLKNKISILQEMVLKVNLANAKLLYTNHALGDASLNERQKNKIVESISKADSVEEAKTIFETLQSTVSGTSGRRAPNSLSEAVSRGRASTLFAGRRKENKSSSPELDRWKILAGIDKK